MKRQETRENINTRSIAIKTIEIQQIIAARQDIIFNNLLTIIGI